MSKELQFVVTVEAAEEPSGDRDLGTIVRRVALELRRAWNVQFPTERVTEIKVVAPDTDYSISFDVPLEGPGVYE